MVSWTCERGARALPWHAQDAYPLVLPQARLGAERAGTAIKIARPAPVDALRACGAGGGCRSGLHLWCLLGTKWDRTHYDRQLQRFRRRRRRRRLQRYLRGWRWGGDQQLRRDHRHRRRRQNMRGREVPWRCCGRRRRERPRHVWWWRSLLHDLRRHRKAPQEGLPRRHRRGCDGLRGQGPAEVEHAGKRGHHAELVAEGE